LLSNHYNLTRTAYYRQLDAASRSGGDLIPFLDYAVRGLIDGLREQLGIVREKHMEEIWTNFVHDEFRDKSSPADQRKRHLVLDLSQAPLPVPRTQLRQLSPRLAEAYAGRTSKTLSRDINDLMKMELIGRSPAGYFVRRDRITAFLPRATQGLI
jgi:hypothetical protein